MAIILDMTGRLLDMEQINKKNILDVRSWKLSVILIKTGSTLDEYLLSTVVRLWWLSLGCKDNVLHFIQNPEFPKHPGARTDGGDTRDKQSCHAIARSAISRSQTITCFAWRYLWICPCFGTVVGLFQGHPLRWDFGNPCLSAYLSSGDK